MLRKVLIRVLILAILTSFYVGCPTLGKTDLKDFAPSDYSEFVTDAFDDYWKVLDDVEKKGVNPMSWKSFADMNTQFEANNIDVEKEFITRMLKKDKLWSKYGSDRKKYELDNPGKTYKDQIAYFISETLKIPQTVPQT